MSKSNDKIKCCWLNQKKQPCPWQIVSKDSDFCKRHSVYEGIYTKDDIPNLIFCSGCKNMFKQKNEDIKRCDKCYIRSQQTNNKIKEKNKVEKNLCKGVTQTGTPCTYYAKENDHYCEKHQSYKKWKELVDNGNNICKNWIRGCFNIIDKDRKSCKDCRNKEQEQENKLNNKKKNIAIEHNNNNNDDKTSMCVICNKIDNKSNFTNGKCLNCYNSYKKNEMNRNVSDPLITKMRYCKKGAKNRDIKWELSDEFAIKLIKNKCNYCDKLVSYNGIDRIDSNKHYTENNCVSCCKYCNIMKRAHSVENFLNIVKYLLSINFIIKEFVNKEHSKLFEFSKHSNYNRFLTDINKKNKSNELTEEMYNEIIKQPCTYCKNLSTNELNYGARGIDRINATKGYIIGNVTPCCKTCNYIKNDLSTNEFYEHLQSIYNFSCLKINNLELSIQEKIMNLCKSVKKMNHEKFFHNDEYYNNLTFNYNNIEQIKKIKIHLEFVVDKNQHDIWNYYRRNVSSLKKIENAKLIGRQIYILVKDLTTKKYLGIISLSSDMYNLEKRDNYIGWNFEDKKDKLEYIMNMSTCVPLQPFGFNFNGGKLLASLAFSKEVLMHFRDKYNRELLGITTTSLYGKSIQYDRLSHLKFLGYTKGYSVKDIPSEVTKLCSEYIKQEYKQDYPLRKKFIIIQSAFEKLNISKEDLLKSNEKGIYFGFTCKDSKNFLNGIIENCPDVNTYNLKTANEITNWWINRWAIQRHKNLKNNNKLIE